MERIEALLKQFKAQTDVDVYIYDAYGNFKTSTVGSEHETLDFSLPDLCDFAASDRLEDVTYFDAGGGLIGLIDGSKEGDRVCACALSLLCRSLSTARQKPLSKTEAVRKMLAGETLKEDYGMSGAYYMLRLHTDQSKIEEIENYLYAVSQNTDLVVRDSADSVVYLKQCDLSGDEYRSASEFASVLYDSIMEETRLNLKIAVGGVAHGSKEFSECYAQTQFAMKLGLSMDKDSGVYGYKEYALVKMLEEFPPSVLKRYYDMLADKEFDKVLSDSELTATAEAFFKNNLNVSETGRNMYLHRNTLLYRLDKIEKATGLNVRRFNDALTFRVVVILKNLMQKQ